LDPIFRPCARAVRSKSTDRPGARHAPPTMTLPGSPPVLR
jgi:hypothetical protein